MPFLISPEQQADWLSHAITDPQEARGLLEQATEKEIVFHRVSKAVGNVANDGPELIEPAPSDIVR